ncbi:prepilin peptidase [Plantactinospora sp. CA-290183]|uniref:prepilin peptidase n=1 Tax=Plantactinospora sp. CA-290183 TaxID=3240006 RepID=UPI003D8B3254
MNPGAVVAAGLAGAALGPLLRARILRYAVPAGTPWRRDCPYCATALVRPGPRGLADILPPTGACPRCGERIGPAPGLVEVVAATVLGALAWRIGGTSPLLAYGWIAGFGIVLGFVDVAVRRLPDRLTLPAAAGGLALFGLVVLAGEAPPGRLGTALLCALAVTGCYLGLVLVSGGGLGPGDARLAFGTGLATGWYGTDAAFLGVVGALLLASGYAGTLLALRRIGRTDPLPHGPFLLTAALVAVLLR